jgi:hypothetical protein
MGLNICGPFVGSNDDAAVIVIHHHMIKADDHILHHRGRGPAHKLPQLSVLALACDSSGYRVVRVRSREGFETAPERHIS